MTGLAAWAWGVIGLAVFLAVGLLAALALGAAGTPADAARRAGQRIGLRRHVYKGVELPPEVPEAERAAPEDRTEPPARDG